MHVSYDVTSTLRAETKHHEPIVLIYDARGNGGGCSMPNNHRRTSEPGDGLHGNRVLCFTPTQHGVYAEGLGTLRASGGDIGGGSEVLVVEPIVFRDDITIKVDGGGSDRKGYNGITQDGTSTTLTAEEKDRPLAATAIVRRLTPLECERLQGMPDDWSKYGINEKGEVYELPDSARYRLQGNGIATPFWKWMLKRISAQYERDPTMGSLFDGQASFPMIWEGINGEGTCRWFSEIEKHAVAVAKYHFPAEEET